MHGFPKENVFGELQGSSTNPQSRLSGKHFCSLSHLPHDPVHLVCGARLRKSLQQHARLTDPNNLTIWQIQNSILRLDPWTTVFT
jgi:hypothetical protein